MAKKLISIRASLETVPHIAWLRARWGETQTAIVARALERAYQAEQVRVVAQGDTEKETEHEHCL